ncbi:hypothetical protein FSP39_010692 [Pinctada imbricata]|uniref:BZIP domain-containing protein n=1 Tax=Pinctada imbricata TaxID=66713 RepID=A0AA89BRQ7_PINIB|nr:hypothetical protein FSP39_010692 [Pinctada imbricata]
MTAQPFDESNASISKLMAGAIMIDGNCSDLPWTDSFPVSHSPLVKLERNHEPFTNNLDCWQLPPNDYAHPAFQHRTQNNGLNSVTNGSMSGQETNLTSNSFLPNFGNNQFKPPQDQCRQKYGNYSNEKYPDFHVKPEMDDNKWPHCAMTPGRDMYNLRPTVNNPSSSKDEAYSPPASFNGSSLGQKSSPTNGEKKLDFPESDSDSKTSGTDSQGHGREWPSNSNTPPLDINVDDMINNGVTVAGYKPRKLICKRKKSSIPSEQKDPGYWEKRKKNNDSARRSREAKKEKERNFYKRALELEYENHYLKERVAFLERKLEAVMQQNPGFHGNDSTPPM